MTSLPLPNGITQASLSEPTDITMETSENFNMLDPTLSTANGEVNLNATTMNMDNPANNLNLDSSMSTLHLDNPSTGMALENPTSGLNLENIDTTIFSDSVVHSDTMGHNSIHMNTSMSTTNIHSDPLMSPTRLSNDDVTLSSTATSTWTQNALSINNEHDLMADMTKPITEQNLNQMNMASDMLDSSANGLSLANLTSADQTSPHSPLSISVSLPSDITVSLPSEAELPTAGLNLVDKPTVESTGILPLASTTDSAILPLVSTVDTAMDSTGILPLASSTDPAILPLVTTADSVITSNDLPMPAPMVETTGVSENPAAVTDNAIQATSLAVPTSSNILSPRLLSPSLEVEHTGQPIRTQRIALDNSYKVPKISLLLDNGVVPKPPPRPPQLPLDQLYPPTPSITIENRREAVSPALRNFCIDKRNPVTVIKGMCKALKLDLSMFTTRRLVEQNPEHPMEIRHQ